MIQLGCLPPARALFVLVPCTSGCATMGVLPHLGEYRESISAYEAAFHKDDRVIVFYTAELDYQGFSVHSESTAKRAPRWADVDLRALPASEGIPWYIDPHSERRPVIDRTFQEMPIKHGEAQ